MHTPPPFPANRPRRLRRDAFTRALVREHQVHASDLILPVFVQASPGLTRMQSLALPRRRASELAAQYVLARAAAIVSHRGRVSCN